MDLHIPAMARKSCVSDAIFEKGDRVVSLLARARPQVGGEEQEVARIDALESELDRVEAPGEEICRWTQTFKPRRKDDREDQEAMKLTADNLFMSLFEGDDRFEHALRVHELDVSESLHFKGTETENMLTGSACLHNTAPGIDGADQIA